MPINCLTSLAKQQALYSCNGMLELTRILFKTTGAICIIFLVKVCSAVKGYTKHNILG